MNRIRMAALALIVCGVLGLVYGSFTYTKDTHEADLGVVQLSIDEKETINIPVWLGAGLVVVGVFMLLGGPKKA